MLLSMTEEKETISGSNSILKEERELLINRIEWNMENLALKMLDIYDDLVELGELGDEEKIQLRKKFMLEGGDLQVLLDFLDMIRYRFGVNV